MYNAPELWREITEQSRASYDGIKADIFAAAITLFMLQMKLQPFRRAQPNDPYFKRLIHKDKRYFWKIFEGYQICPLFKDLFEKMTFLDAS